MNSVLRMVTVGVVFLAAAPAWGQADARAVIDRAIKAAGGADNLAKVHGTKSRIKGTMNTGNEEVPFTGSDTFAMPDRMRIQMEMTRMDKTMKTTQVVNGKEGWIRIGDYPPQEMNQMMLDDAKQQLYAYRVTRLIPLTEKDYQLTALGDKEIDKRKAVGVRVAHKGFNNIDLYFDKDSGLLLASEARVKPLAGPGKEIVITAYYSDYKKVGGVAMAHKLFIQRDGQPLVRSESSNIQILDKVDDKEFAKP